MCGSFADLEEPTIIGPGVRARGRGVAAKRRGFGTGVTARFSAGAAVSARRWSHCDVDARRPKVSEDSRPPGQHAGIVIEPVGSSSGIEWAHRARLPRGVALTN